MIHVSFAMTAAAFEDCSKTETRRFWKPAHAAKFYAGREFMGTTKDFRYGGKRIHSAHVLFCRQERLGDMTEDSFLREGGTRYWKDREEYIKVMGGPDRVPWVLRFSHGFPWSLIFCSVCDYVMDKLERDSLRCRPDSVMCPRCLCVNLTQFYNYGSQTHRDRRAAWERGEISGAPLPFPDPYNKRWENEHERS